MSMEAQGIPMPKLPRATFNRSKKRVGTYRKGLIYPIYCKYMKPNDHVSFSIESVARKLPTLAPSFTEERIVIRAFTVPLRTLWKNWKNWQTGFKEYSDNTPFNEDVPRWNPSNIKATGVKSLWTHLGYPANCKPDVLPADFKRQAYAWVYDTYFRYRPIQQSILADGEPGTWTGEDLQVINKDRDFFTTGLPYQQLGDAVSLPITGDTKADFLETDQRLRDLFLDFPNNPNKNYVAIKQLFENDTNYVIMQGKGNPDSKGTGRMANSDVDQANITSALNTALDEKKVLLKNILNNNTVKMDKISSATVSMIRHAFARQMRAESLARSGVFYPDVLLLNWGTAPSYEVLGLPKYIGGATINMVNSEVLQTSATNNDSPLGEMGGHSMGVGEANTIDAYVKEFSVLLVVAYIKHEQFYSSQGLSQEEYFESNEDLGLIEFQHMSEQPVPKRTLLCVSTLKPTIEDDGVTTSFGEEDATAGKYNKDTLFFQPIYEHMRTEQNDVVGLMIQEQFYKKDGTIFKKNNLYNWIDSDIYSIKDGERPAFNSEFLKLKYDNRNYAVVKDGNDLEDNYLIWWNIKADWVSVLDKYGMPGQLDHIGEI